MKTTFLASIALAALLFAGCSSTPALLTPASVTSDVAGLTRIGLDVYPAAMPEVSLARDVICGAAAVTNVDPAAIVLDLSKLTSTNAETKIIVDGAMWVYEKAYAIIGTNTTTQIQPYLQAVCDGLTQALPSTGLMTVNSVPRKVILPPHWR